MTIPGNSGRVRLRARAKPAPGPMALVLATWWVLCATTGFAGAAEPARVTLIKTIAARAMKHDHLKSIVFAVRIAGKTVYTGALRESMTGVPATPDMHFRNGAMAFTYISTMLLELVDRKRVTLDTKLSAFFPALPHADRITLKNLANMTSGYADYVYEPEVLRGTSLDPFRQWTSERLINIGPWITQTKNFAGAGATVGYLRAKRIAIAVATTLTAAAFDAKGNSGTPSIAIFSSLADALAPHTLPVRNP